jgi:hypothetical protein
MKNMVDKIDEIKDAISKAVKNLDVDARKWSFSIGKEEESIIVAFSIEVAIKKK